MFFNMFESSSIILFVSLSFAMSFSTLSHAYSIVEWSFLLNMSLSIGNERLSSFLQRYIAICLGITMFFGRPLPNRFSFFTLNLLQTVFIIISGVISRFCSKGI